MVSLYCISGMSLEKLYNINNAVNIISIKSSAIYKYRQVLDGTWYNK